MKKIILSFGIATLLFMAGHANAQVRIQVNIGAPIYAAPVAVAPAPVVVDAPYYYYPDINCYYDPAAARYMFFLNNQWVWMNSIPAPYRGYDFARARRNPINMNEFRNRFGGRAPYMAQGLARGGRNDRMMMPGNGRGNGFNQGRMERGGGRH